MGQSEFPYEVVMIKYGSHFLILYLFNFHQGAQNELGSLRNRIKVILDQTQCSGANDTVKISLLGHVF